MDKKDLSGEGAIVFRPKPGIGPSPDTDLRRLLPRPLLTRRSSAATRWGWSYQKDRKLISASLEVM